MATEENEQSPFTRPGFIAAAVVVALIVVLGIVIGIVNATRDDSEAAPPPSSSATSSTALATESSAAVGGESVCGLDGEVLSGSVSSAPDAQWQFQGTTAYPTSATYGPGDTNEDGVRYCFQHSPEGALFAAANAAVQGSDPSIASSWIEYFLAEDVPGRVGLVSEVARGASPETRMNIAGFRILQYDGESARIDLAVRAVGSGNTAYASTVYDLVWENGDWKLSPESTSNPLRIAEIPDPAGYIAWGE